MSNNTTPDDDAFEYVIGTLRGHERKDFEQALAQDDELQAKVAFWEEQMILSNQPDYERTPKADTWLDIQNAVAPKATSPTRKGLSFFSWKAASMALCCAWLLTLGLWLTPMIGPHDPTAPNSDYVAVLTDTQGEALLTALTASDGSQLWLEWENIELQTESNLQLWAKSRRDGQVRPLHVFDSTHAKTITLDEATWRLIKDASHLLLTQEEVGGSAIDEPSDTLIAQGVCVRLEANST